MAQTTGLWRDGDLLVVNLETANFAQCCPWTSEKVTTTTMVPVYGPRPAGWTVSVARGVRYEAKSQLLTLALPASRGWSERRLADKQGFGYLIALLALATGIAGVLLYFILSWYYAWVFQSPHPNAFTVSVFLMILSPIGIVTGFAWPAIEGAPGPGGYITAELIDEPHIWLHGADPKFLETLPAWNNQPLAQRKKAGPSLSTAISKGWPILFVLALIGAVVVVLLTLRK